jgi:hypothetical protein
MMIATAAKTASEEAHQLQRTTSGATKRSTKIAGFEVKESKSLKEFESAEYISQESIARAIMKPCCTEECLRKKLNTGGGYSCLNFESVYSKILAARKHLFGNEFKDKVTILKAIIQGTLCPSILLFFINNNLIAVYYILLSTCMCLCLHIGGVVHNQKGSSCRMRVLYRLGYVLQLSVMRTG